MSISYHLIKRWCIFLCKSCSLCD